MKRTLVLTAAAMLLAGTFGFAKTSTLIDFTLLEADAVADENGNPLVNNDVVGSQLVSEIKKAVERPALLDFLRSIY